MTKYSAHKLSAISISLHWLVALTMISLLSVGIFMAETETYSLYPIHKSVGVLILIAVLPRIIWRLINGWPEPVAQYSALEQGLAKLVHWLLLLGTLCMPISGMMMSGLGGHGIEVFGLELLASQYDPVSHEAIPINSALAGIGYQVHGALAYLLVIALILHIAGALKHHVLDKDGTLKRMLGVTLKS